MESEKPIWKPVPLALDEGLKKAVEDMAKQLGRKQADVMREAIRAGLPLVKSGGEAVSLDGELSADVGRVAEWHGWTRQRVMLEAIRAGLHAVHFRWVTERDLGDKLSSPAAAALFDLHPDSQPLARDLQAARREAMRLRQLLAEVEATPAGARALETLRARQTPAADAAPKSPKRKAGK